MPLTIGQQLGRYQVVEQLGEGGMATVYKALDLGLERYVAIKVIRRDAMGKAGFLARFEREAKALAHLSHPHIVKILDYGDHEGAPYVVMEFFAGGTLKSKLGAPIPWSEAARTLLPVAHALEYAHRQKVIHRDVKPANILISDSGQVMLSDFGIAKLLEDSGATAITGPGVGIGTPEYMAPEQGQGLPVSYSADIYALGVVFYEMVTGRQPYCADTPMAVLLKHVNDPLPHPRLNVPDLPEDVEGALLKAMAKDPQERYASMGEFAHALEKLAAIGTGVSGPLIGAEPKAGRAIPRWAFVAGALIGLALLSLLCISLGLAGALGIPGIFDREKTPQTAILQTDIAGTPMAEQVDGTPTLESDQPGSVATPTREPTAAPQGAELINASNASRVTLIGRFFGRSASHYRYSPDGRFLSSGSSEIYLYDAATLAEIRSIIVGGSVAVLEFSPEGNLLATSQSERNQVQIWQTGDGSLQQVFEAQAQPANDLAFSPDGSLLAAAGMDGVTLWQVEDGSQVLVHEMSPFGMPHVAFSPEGSLLAVSGYENLVIKLLRSLDGSVVRQLSGAWGNATDLAFSPDGSLLVAADGGDHTSVWQVDTGAQLFFLEDPAPTVDYVMIDMLAFSPHGSLLATGGGDTLVRLWDASSGALLHTLQGNRQFIRGLSFSHDGKILAVEAGELLLFGIQ